MKMIAGLVIAILVGISGGVYAHYSDNPPSAPISVPQTPAALAADEPASNAVVAYTSTIPSGGSSSSSTFITTGSTSGTIMITSLNGTSTINGGVLSISTAPPPQLAITCTDDDCNVNAQDLEQARFLLERIANRSVNINIEAAHDANCHPIHERELIARQDAKPDMVASR